MNILTILDTEWFNIIITAVALGVAGLITLGFTMLKAWITNKIKNENMKNAMIALSEAVHASVLAVQQTFVDQLKKDGKFDKDNQVKALTQAVETTKAMLSAETIKLVEEHVGNLENWIRTQIEASIKSMKG